MSACQFIPGLDHCFCQQCLVFVPTDYQINLLKARHDAAVLKLKEWERNKTKSQKAPKGLKETIAKTLAELNHALSIYEDHTKYAREAQPPPEKKRKPRPPIVMTGYSFDNDDDLELGLHGE